MTEREESKTTKKVWDSLQEGERIPARARDHETIFTRDHPDIFLFLMYRLITINELSKYYTFIIFESESAHCVDRSWALLSTLNIQSKIDRLNPSEKTPSLISDLNRWMKHTKVQHVGSVELADSSMYMSYIAESWPTDLRRPTRGSPVLRCRFRRSTSFHPALRSRRPWPRATFRWSHCSSSDLLQPEHLPHAEWFDAL